MAGAWLRASLLFLALGGWGWCEPKAPAKAPAFTAQAAPVASEQVPALTPAVALAHRMEHLKAAIRKGDTASLNAAIREVDLLRRTYGTLDMGPLVDGLMVWAREEGHQGRAEAGLKAVQVAEHWVTGDAEVIATRVALMRGSGPKGFLWSLPEVLKLNSLRLNHPSHKWLWLVQHLAWLRMMATLLLWGWALTLVLRYRRVFRQLWEEPLFRRGVSPKAIALLGAVLLAFPVLLGLDPGVSAMMGLWMIVPFLLTDEVRITVLILVLQVVHPALSIMEPMAAAEPSPTLAVYQVQPQVKPLPPLLLEQLPKEDQEFLRGWELLTRQEWGGAAVVFQSLVDHHPDQGQVLNNLAVAEFQRGQKAEATRHFEAAAKLLPRSPEILINQSVLAFENLDTVLGTSKQEEARKASPEAFDRLSTVNQVRKEPRTFPLPLPDTDGRVLAVTQAHAEPGNSHWTTRLHFPAILLGFALPLLATLFFLRRLKHSIGMAHPTQCVRCGEPFHTTDSPDPNVCPKCHHLFVLRDGLHQESRKKKLDEVAEYQADQKRIHQSLLFLLPGCDVGFLGDAREGFMEFGAVCFAWSMVIATGRTVRYPGEILPDPVSTWLPLGLILLVVLYVRSWLKLLPRRS